MVRVADVTKSYGGFDAVKDVSFILRGGETIALVGHNGAGKTTLIKLMLGLIRPTAGSVGVLGEDPAAGQFEARRRLGYLPEHVSFNMALTGRETLTFYARLKRTPLKDVPALLDQVGLIHAADRRVGTYSKGMRQRLGLAQALLGDPGVLLLDEPTTGLDPALRRSFYAILEVLREKGATILMSSHALTELESKVDRVIIVNRGRLIADGSIDELRHISRLPTLVRVKFAQAPVEPVRLAVADGCSWTRVAADLYETEAMGDGKIALLQGILNQGTPIADLDVVPPTLDELYAHFLASQEAAQ
ncbi:MAG: ABC transporter ATP-binding protein [Phyllobacterium sp.]